MRVASPANVFLCAGLKSSGSTWLYNAVAELARRVGNRSGLLPVYADSLEGLPAKADGSTLLVIKTHRPTASLEFLTRFAHGKILITVREPRDSIASLMQRFDHRFDACLDEVSVNAARMVDLSAGGDAIILRYEDRFYDRPQTLDLLAEYLDVKLSKSLRRRIFLSLTAPNVEKRIRSLSRQGAFGAAPTADSFDPTTHWHPGHIGDRQVGKYGSVLTPRMQQRVLHALRDYCRVFGYPLGRSAGAAGRARRAAAPLRMDRLADAIPIE